MASNQTPKQRRTGAAATYINALLTAGRVSFPLSALLKESGLSLAAAKCQLSRLGPSVVRPSPSQKFFLIVSPEQSAQGYPPVDGWIDDYFRWLGHPYYLALQSAASAHGANPQAIQVTQVMTDSPRRPLRIGRLRIVFFVKRGIERTPTQQLANALAPTRLSTPAATGFDLVRYAARIGGIGRAIETLRPLLPLLRTADLLATLEAEGETATAQRLGYVLDRLGRKKDADVIDRWLIAKRTQIPLAVSAAIPASGPRDSRWHIVDNSGEFES
jgi:hypothetical protein